MGFHLDVDMDGDRELEAAFAAAPKELGDALHGAVDDSGTKLRDAWRRNARATARRHGRDYPRTITTEVSVTEGAVQVDVGPESGLPQGGMGRGFEYGSVNQPPHMDGARALATTAQSFDSAVDKAIDAALEGL